MIWSSLFNVWPTASTRRPKGDKSVHTIVVPPKISCPASQSNEERGRTRETLLGSAAFLSLENNGKLKRLYKQRGRNNSISPAYPTPMILFVSVHFTPQIIRVLRTWTYSR